MPSAACASARVPTTGLSAPRGQLRIWTGRSKSACRISARRSAFGAPTKVYGGSDVWRWKSLQSAAGRRLSGAAYAVRGHASRLFVRGALPADEQKTAAIVGARICTAYGKSQAAFFAQVLAANGVAVISGLACGIDAAAHEGALRGKGKTFAVLGCGVDICYPKQNYPLMRRMLENGGGVLSEFPPGAEPLPWHFPIRNRVISALADVVLVIEAKEKSGSLITADYALEQGKTVFALPGRTTDATSRGCNRLIAQGAEIAISPETILEELGVKKAGTKRAAPRPRYGKEAEMVLKTLAAEPQNLAQLAGSTGIPLQELTGILLALEIDGVIAENPPGVYMALS